MKHYCSNGELTSLVCTLEKTSEFQMLLDFWTKSCKPVPVGISASTNRHALAEDIKEMPTLEVILLSVNLKTAPTLSDPLAL